jgi:hypothetical protein
MLVVRTTERPAHPVGQFIRAQQSIELHDLALAMWSLVSAYITNLRTPLLPGHEISPSPAVLAYRGGAMRYSPEFVE